MDENVKTDKGYIHDDVKGRPFLIFTVIFVIFSVISVAVVYFLYQGLAGYHDRAQGEVPTRVETGRIEPPEPKLQADPVADMVAMDTAQSELLASYGWVDKEKGVARIPIDKAIELTLEHSLVKAQTPAAPVMEQLQ